MMNQQVAFARLRSNPPAVLCIGSLEFQRVTHEILLPFKRNKTSPSGLHKTIDSSECARGDVLLYLAV